MRILIAALLLFSLSSYTLAEGRYIVKYKDSTTSTLAARGLSRSQSVAGVGGIARLDLPSINGIAVELSDAQLAALKASADVDYIEVDQPRYPMAQEVPYGIVMVQADQLNDAAAGNTTVCIIDSGFDITHFDLAANIVNGTNDGGTGNWFEDGSSHGTHVAGTIAALNNSIGVVGTMGSGNINLHIVKVFGDDGSWAYSSELIDALRACNNAGADVVNMSLGGPFASATEEQGMNQAESHGMLLVAAAGNDGNTSLSYPASYDSVVSVAAIDSNKNLADFSQRNLQVEISAPGVGILSTIPMHLVPLMPVLQSCVDGACVTLDSEVFEGAGEGYASGSPVNCGLFTSSCPQASGNICVIERGEITFAEKAQRCESAGGVGAVIYNNVAGEISGTLSGSIISIPVVGALQQAGPALLASDTVTIEVSSDPSPDGNYDSFDGTSMASPHVAGAAALLWSNFPECTNDEIRNAINLTAEDLGAVGRDTSFGYGLLQIQSAWEHIDTAGCGTVITPIDLYGRVTNGKVQMRWTGTIGPTVDIHVNGEKRVTINDNGQLSTSSRRWAGQTVDFNICEPNGSGCSNTLTLMINP